MRNRRAQSFEYFSASVSQEAVGAITRTAIELQGGESAETTSDAVLSCSLVAEAARITVSDP